MRLHPKLLLLTTLVLVYSAHGHKRTFTRCQLSRELLRYNFPRTLIPNYKQQRLVQKGRKGGNCSMKCEDLLNEDLADDVRCAKRIYDRVGFKAWPSSYAYCKEKSLPDLSRC